MPSNIESVLTETDVNSESNIVASALENTLQQKIDFLIRGDIGSAQKLDGETKRLAQQFGSYDIAQNPACNQRTDNIRKLYQKISLILNSHKTDTIDQIRKISKGKKVLGAYKKGV